jgi:hypothetical protein
MWGLLLARCQALSNNRKRGKLMRPFQMRRNALRTTRPFSYWLEIGTSGDDMLRHLEKL